jgi:hypothetical protein
VTINDVEEPGESGTASFPADLGNAFTLLGPTQSDGASQYSATIELTFPFETYQEYFTYVNVEPVPFTPDLRADTNRDGQVTSADEQGKATWSAGAGQSGAVILPNSDDDNGGGGAPDNWSGGTWNGKNFPANMQIDGNGDINDIAPLWAQMFNVNPLPPNLVVTLAVSQVANEDPFFAAIPANNRVRVFMPTKTTGQDVAFQQGDTEIVGPTKGASVQFVQNPNGNQQSYNIFSGNGGITFGIEGIEAGSMVDITMTATLGGQQVGQDVVRVRVAPFVLNDQTQPVVQGGNEKTVFASNADPSLVQALQNTFGGNFAVDTGSDLWEQDGCEVGYAQAPYGQMPIVLELPRSTRNNGSLRSFIEGTMLQPDVGVIAPFAERGIRWAGNDPDSGGDIESLPKAGGGPGYLLYDSAAGPNNNPAPLSSVILDFFGAQAVNDRLGVNTSWLAVGHVDEVVSLAPDGQHVMLADPDLAWGLLLWANQLDPNAAMLQGMNDLTGNLAPNGIPVGQVVQNAQLEAYNLSVVMNPANLPSVWSIVENAMGILPPESTPVAAANNQGNGQLTTGGAFTAFFPDSRVRTYAITFTDNAGDYELEYQEAGGSWIYGGQGNAATDCVFPDARAFILAAWWNGMPKQGDTFAYLADPTSKLVEMPVLFAPDPNPQANNRAGEYTPDFVNSLIANGNTVITGDAFGPDVGWFSPTAPATDIFQDYSGDAFALARIGTGGQNINPPTYVDGRYYSNREGFIHCATNVIRQIPASKWWTV